MKKMWTRREVLKSGSAVAAAGLLLPLYMHVAKAQENNEALPSLREVAAAKGVLFGAAVGPKILRQDAAFGAAIARECNLIVPENALKWDAVHPSNKVWSFEGAEEVFAFANKNDMKKRGQTLIWNGAFPNWAKEALTEGRGEALMEEYIRTVVSRYRGQLISWDVVNEVINLKDGRADGLRATPWLKALGPTYIDRAFKLAAEADPGCQLVYNDFGHESYGKQSGIILNLVRSLKQRQVPLHAVGMQSHLSAKWNIDQRQLTRFCKEVADLGLEIVITELDVSDSGLPDDPKQRDQVAADRTRAFLEAVSEAVKPKQILTWGLSDRYSWLNTSKEQNPAGREVRSLPLDRNYVRKAMWLELWNYFRQLT